MRLPVGSGIAALLLQMLDPAVLAGVWDHSRFRADMSGRLRLAMRPALRVDSRTREIARLIMTQPAPNRALEPLHLLTRAAGVELLPDWARRLHGFRPVPGPLVRAGTQGLARTLRWAFA